MNEIKESQSNWECVTDLLKSERPIALGRYVSYWYHQTPRRLLHSLSYYKFAAKMIGSNKRVMDIGCNEGLGSWLLAQECGFCKGVDFDDVAIATARQNFVDTSITFACEDVLSSNEKGDIWDAVTHFDVIEHIYPEHAGDFFRRIVHRLKEDGIMVLGTPSKISQEFASPISRKGHVNIYTHERLYEEVSEYFEHVFLFSANDELVHTGYLPLAHYFIVLACKPKKEHL